MIIIILLTDAIVYVFVVTRLKKKDRDDIKLMLA